MKNRLWLLLLVIILLLRLPHPSGAQTYQFGCLSCTQTWSATNTFASVLVTGTIDGQAPVTLTTGSSANLGSTYNSGYTYNQEATAATAVTYTLPTPAAGKQYCVKNSYNGSAADTGTLEIIVANTGTQSIIYNGSKSASGYIISAGAAGDAACVIGISTTQWEAYAQVGTWTLH